MTPRIACIHQGYELYGSDRSFAESVAALRQAFPDAEIEVVLPRRGPILGLLQGTASRVVIEPLWVLRRRNLPKLLAAAPVALPLAVLRAARAMRDQEAVLLLADDPVALIDVPALAAAHGWRVELRALPGHAEFLLTKPV